MSWWNSFVKWLESLLGLTPKPPPPNGEPQPMHRRVLLLVFNPVIPSRGGLKLTEVMSWNDPDRLADDYAADLRDASGGLADFEVVDRIEVDGWPVKKSGFCYTVDTFLTAWHSHDNRYENDPVNYGRLVADHQLLSRVAAGEIDEVWLFGSPWAGFSEAAMGGPKGLDCNGPILSGTDAARRRFIIMGFNFERGVGEMLEDFCHRTERLLDRVWRFQGGNPQQNLWQRFTLYDQIAPGQAHCGTVHYAPNSAGDYDWGNPRYVPSSCDDWLTFPDFKGVVKQVNSAEWGGGNTRAHHLWWLRHLPRVAGQTNGISNNWWAYAVDPNTVS